MKKIAAIALALALLALLTLLVSPALLAGAAENQYYLVEGFVTPEGAGEITRVERVDGVITVETTPGTEYAVAANDGAGALLGSCAFGVSFEPPPDLPEATLDEARFAVLIPYSEAIGEFTLVDRQAKILSSVRVNAAQGEIALFEVGETGEGFALRWEAEAGNAALDYDVYAVSRITGEKNVLAYRAAESELFVPYGWLDPDDTIVFVLQCNDGSSTLTAESEAFSTPSGEAKDILDDEAWEGQGEEAEEAEEDPEWYWYLIVLFLFVVLPVGVIVLIIVLVKKRKKGK